MKLKQTVSIGIPAFNEAKNLRRIVEEILSQSCKSVEIQKIYIMSDASTDHSQEVVDSFVSGEVKIKFIDGKTRMGKPARVNQFFQLCDSDIAIVFDADIELGGKGVVEALVTPIVQGSADFSSGFSTPIKPKGVVQNVAMAGVEIWDDCRLTTPSSSIYFSEGAVRAFSKKVYKLLEFPNTSADDIYSYIWGVSNGFKFASRKEALVYYSLPYKFSDYIKQQRRYIRSQSIHKGHFDKSLVDAQFVIDDSVRAKAGIKSLKKKPLYTILYFAISLYIRVLNVVHPHDNSSIWDMLHSTKNLIGK